MEIKKLIKNHFCVEKIYRLFRFIPDETYLKIRFRLRIGRKLNLKSPRSFNEKIQWLKLHDRNPMYTTLVDKCAVKDYVASIIGDEYIIPNIGVWNAFDDIDFNQLPNQFVLKCSHDSGGVVVCKDMNNFSITKARKKIKSSLKSNFYWVGREWPYKNVPPRIIAEQFIGTSDSDALVDYKLMCFGGNVKCSFTCTERNTGLKVTFFDRDWNRMPFARHYPMSEKEICKPVHYEKMVELAEKLAKGLNFVRVDFYEVNGQIYFGELTLYPGDGLEEFTPAKWDYELGEWLELILRN